MRTPLRAPPSPPRFDSTRFTRRERSAKTLVVAFESQLIFAFLD
jgi:hypothetical protein